MTIYTILGYNNLVYEIGCILNIIIVSFSLLNVDLDLMHINENCTDNCTTTFYWEIRVIMFKLLCPSLFWLFINNIRKKHCISNALQASGTHKCFYICEELILLLITPATSSDIFCLYLLTLQHLVYSGKLRHTGMVINTLVTHSILPACACISTESFWLIVHVCRRHNVGISFWVLTWALVIAYRQPPFPLGNTANLLSLF